MFKEAIKHICPFEYDLIYTIMGVYSECAKGREITIDDPILTRQVDHTKNRLVRLVKEGGKNKRYVQIFREYFMVGMLRGIIDHFVKDPTLFLVYLLPIYTRDKFLTRNFFEKYLIFFRFFSIDCFCSK